MAAGQRWLHSRFGHIPGAVVWLTLGMAIESTGFAFFWPFTTLYVHEILGRSLAVAGIVLMAQSGASMVGSWLGGLLFDRRGGRPTVLTALLIAVGLLLALAAGGPFWLYGALSTAFGLATGVVWPALYAWAASVWPEGGRSAFNALYVAQNMGVALGSVLGGLVASRSLRSTFLAAAVLVAIFWLIVVRRYRGPAFRPVRSPVPRARAQGRVAGPVVLLAVGLALDWIAYVQWQTTTPVYMQREGYALPAYSLLWTLNGVLILVGQVAVSWLTRRVRDVKRQLLVGNALMVLAYVLLATNAGYATYVVAMGFTTFGEMLVWPGVPAMAARLADVGAEGRYQGLVSAAGATGRMVGPLLGGILAGGVTRSALYLVMVAVYGAGLSAFVVHDRLGRLGGRTNRTVPADGA
jgi:MFS family permease